MDGVVLCSSVLAAAQSFLVAPLSLQGLWVLLPPTGIPLLLLLSEEILLPHREVELGFL